MSHPIRPQPHKHQTILRELERQLAALQAGDRLPSERQLAAAFGCTITTLRKVMAALETAGRITRVHGSGTFVADPTTRAAPPVGIPRVGMLIDGGADAYAHAVMRALATEAAERGIDLRSAWCADLGPAARPQVEALTAEGCIAIVVPWFTGGRADALRQLVRSAPLPISMPVLVPGLEDQCFEPPERFGVTLESTMDALVHYLATLGHRRIAFLGPDVDDELQLQRALRACTAQITRRDLDVHVGLIGPEPEAMDRLAARWRTHAGELAVISYDDAHALRFVVAMRRLGLSAPADYAIIGWNDTEESRLCDPPLTTVAHDFAYSARWLLRNALALAAGGTDRSDETAPQILRLRASCGGAGRVDDALAAALRERGLLLDDPSAPAAARA